MNKKIIIPISDFKFDESIYAGKWKASTLYTWAKGKDYPILDLPLWTIDLSTNGFDAHDLKTFIFQCKRVKNCSLNYPILLSDTGQIADGYHRVCKAILEGKETIKAIRLLTMPPEDYKE